MSTTALRLAATCLPVRDTSDGMEVLMVQRNPELSFGGMWTFPGGGLEPGDGPQPESVDETSQDWLDDTLIATAAAAAARETLEETALRCDSDSLVLYSHWIPPLEHGPPKRFATWFFLGSIVSGTLELDRTENAEAVWIRPALALDGFRSGDFPLAVPTWVTLNELRTSTSKRETLDAARSVGPRVHHTTAFRTDQGAVLVWEGDAALDGGLDAPGPRNRVVMSRDGSLARVVED